MVTLDERADLEKRGLSKDKEYACMQRVDPGEPYAEGGAMILEHRRIEKESSK